MKPRILVIDDNPDVRLILEVRLHRAGFDVVTAESGSQGIELVRSQHPAIILVDLNMPGMTGIEFLTTVQQRGSEARIYAMTENDTRQWHAETAQDLGAEGLISKTQALAREFPALLLGRLSAARSRSQKEPPRDEQPALAA